MSFDLSVSVSVIVPNDVLGGRMWEVHSVLASLINVLWHLVWLKAAVKRPYKQTYM